MAGRNNVKLLLLENVYNLGIVGDVVEVRPGYARNYLLPMGLATQPTEGNIQKVEQRRAAVERQLREKRAEQERLLETLEGHEITLQRSANAQGHLYGSVSQHDIAEALRAEGFNIEDREIRIGEQIKSLDSYDIPVQFDQDLRATIKLWVVSDKPAEELDADGNPIVREGAEGEQAQEEKDPLAMSDEEQDRFYGLR